MTTVAVPASVNAKEDRIFLNKSYIDYINGAGFSPWIVPYCDGNSMMTPEIVAEKADVLLLPGGKDIDPTYYGKENIQSISVDPSKDAFERTLFQAFVAAQKPIFGICRGFQLIGCEYFFSNGDVDAGDLVRFLSNITGHDGPGHLDVKRNIRTQLIYNRGPFVNHTTPIREAIYGEETDEPGHTMFINSIHHQGIAVSKAAAGVNYNIFGACFLAFSTRGMKEDGSYLLAEALEIPHLKVKAVQWHPEELQEYKILANFWEKYKPQEEESDRVFGAGA